jgi:hypothetical protein
MICLYIHFKEISESTVGFLATAFTPTSSGSQRVKNRDNFNFTFILKRMANNYNLEVPVVMTSEAPYIN